MRQRRIIEGSAARDSRFAGALTHLDGDLAVALVPLEGQSPLLDDLVLNEGGHHGSRYSNHLGKNGQAQRSASRVGVCRCAGVAQRFRRGARCGHKSPRARKALALRGALDDSVRGDALGAFATREVS